MPKNNSAMSNLLKGSALPLFLAAFLLLGSLPGMPRSADASSTDASANAGKAEKGDLVRVNYTVTLEDGSLVSSTLPALAKDDKLPRSGWTEFPRELAPAVVLAGEKGALPGLGEAVVGMAPGEKKRLTLSAAQAYGTRDERKVIKQPRESKVPRTLRVSAKEYVEKFNTFPVVGKEVQLVPNITTRVGEVGASDVRLDLSAKDGASYQQSFGTVDVKVAEDAITLRLTPRLGASYAVQGGEGRVVAVDSDSYTIDLNHPLAGKQINLDLELVSFTKGESFKGVNVGWVEGHEAGLAAAKQAGKPAVLVLYAEWCQWCKKLFAESAQDPRVKELKDSFVWIKVNSNQQAQYKEKYGQGGFPMVVLLQPDGTVASKNEGFLDGAALASGLRAFLAERERKSTL